MSEFSKLLVTTDFSDQATPGLEQAAALARRLGSQILLLYVVEDHLPPILMFTSDSERREILERQRLAAAEALRRCAEQHLPDSPVETVTSVGVAAAEIVAAADKAEVDLIVMASHGYGPIRQLVLGSTTERVLHHAHCPVLVVPSQGKGTS